MGDAAELFGTRGLVKIRGAIDGEPFDGALMAQGDGTHRLPVKAKIRKAIGKEAGDTVHVRIDERIGVAPRVDPVRYPPSAGERYGSSTTAIASISIRQAGVGQCVHTQESVGRLVISEQRHSTLFNRRQVLLPVVDDEDPDFVTCSGLARAGSEQRGDVLERLARLNRRITRANEVAPTMPRPPRPATKTRPRSSRDDDMGIRLGGGEVRGIDAFERHRVGGLLGFRTMALMWSDPERNRPEFA